MIYLSDTGYRYGPSLKQRAAGRISGLDQEFLFIVRFTLIGEKNFPFSGGALPVSNKSSQIRNGLVLEDIPDFQSCGKGFFNTGNQLSRQ